MTLEHSFIQFSETDSGVVGCSSIIKSAGGDLAFFIENKFLKKVWIKPFDNSKLYPVAYVATELNNGTYIEITQDLSLIGFDCYQIVLEFENTTFKFEKIEKKPLMADDYTFVLEKIQKIDNTLSLSFVLDNPTDRVSVMHSTDSVNWTSILGSSESPRTVDIPDQLTYYKLQNITSGRESNVISYDGITKPETVLAESFLYFYFTLDTEYDPNYGVVIYSSTDGVNWVSAGGSPKSPRIMDIPDQLKYYKLYYPILQLESNIISYDGVTKPEIVLADSEVFESRPTLYSNIIKFSKPEKYTSLLEYYCNEQSFGFPYQNDYKNKVRLPIHTYAPQFPKEDKIYVKRTGERVVMSETIDCEWQCETDYLTVEMHKKILIALLHDHTYIDGSKVTISDNYDIDWDNYTYNDCHEKTAKATFKVKGNVSYRNSNC